MFASLQTYKSTKTPRVRLSAVLAARLFIGFAMNFPKPPSKLGVAQPAHCFHKTKSLYSTQMASTMGAGCATQHLIGIQPNPTARVAWHGISKLNKASGGRDRNTTRATLGQSLSVSAFPLYVPV